MRKLDSAAASYIPTHGQTPTRCPSALPRAWVLVLSVLLTFILGTGTVAAQTITPTDYQIARSILQEHCVSCHAPDAQAPMSFRKSAEVRPWARAITAMVDRGEHVAGLTQHETAVLKAWLAAGALSDPEDDDIIVVDARPTFKPKAPDVTFVEFLTKTGVKPDDPRCFPIWTWARRLNLWMENDSAPCAGHLSSDFKAEAAKAWQLSEEIQRRFGTDRDGGLLLHVQDRNGDSAYWRLQAFEGEEPETNRISLQLRGAGNELHAGTFPIGLEVGVRHRVLIRLTKEQFVTGTTDASIRVIHAIPATISAKLVGDSDELNLTAESPEKQSVAADTISVDFVFFVKALKRGTFYLSLIIAETSEAATDVWARASLVVLGYGLTNEIRFFIANHWQPLLPTFVLSIVGLARWIGRRAASRKANRKRQIGFIAQRPQPRATRAVINTTCPAVTVP